jgi:hypothetical protein
MELAVVPAKLLFALSLFAFQFPVPVKGEDIIVRSSAARPAIQRILEADNLDIERLPAGEVAARMREIGRGAAPVEFWAAYQEHVRAWTDYAEAKTRARRSDPLQVDDAPDGRTIAAARRRINATFDVVEAIAKRYGAWPPRTPTRL